jgi:glutamate-1-semialdehyde 2,1-aminomutase
VEGFFLAGDLPKYLHLELLNRGFYSAPRGMLVISTAMDDDVIDNFLGEFAEALNVVKPYVEEQATHLLVAE